MAPQKPLPELPKSNNFSVLSTEARHHRARLIQHFLGDLNEPAIERRRDGWLYVLEEALDDLSREIHRNDWLKSIQRGRVLKQTISATKSRVDTEQSSTPTQEFSSSVDEDKKELQNSSNATEVKPLPDKPIPAIPPFQQVQTLASRPSPPPGEPRAGHLVLCLAPYRTKALDVDSVAANIGCTFTSGTYTLQADEEVDTVIFGLDGLDGVLCIHPQISINSPRFCFRISSGDPFTTCWWNLRLEGHTFTITSSSSIQSSKTCSIHTSCTPSRATGSIGLGNTIKVSQAQAPTVVSFDTNKVVEQ